MFVSKGVGRQIFAGGGGVAYGIVFSGASLVVLDYSANARPARSSRRCWRRPTPTAPRTYVPAGGTQSTAFRISGTRLPRHDHGLEHVQRRRRLRAPAVLRGKGTLIVNGAREPLERRADQALGKVPEGRQAAVPAAVTGAPPAGAGAHAAAADHRDHDRDHRAAPSG